MSEEKNKYCPFSFANPETVDRCSDDCKWNIGGDCIIVLLVESLNRLNQILYNMYHYEKYGKR